MLELGQTCIILVVTSRDSSVSAIVSARLQSRYCVRSIYAYSRLHSCWTGVAICSNLKYTTAQQGTYSEPLSGRLSEMN